MKRLIYIFIYLFTITSCKEIDDRNTVDYDRVKLLMNQNRYYKYPDLKTFVLKRKTISYSNNFELNYLCDTTSNPKDYQYLVEIYKDKKTKLYLPIPSNSLRDYWNFSTELKRQTDSSFNSTFEKELNYCLTQLNDTNYSDWEFVNELFKNILVCEEIHKHELGTFHLPWNISHNGIEYLGEDDFQLNEKRMIEVATHVQLDSNAQQFIDYDNNRIYSITYSNMRFQKKPCIVKMKIFRIETLIKENKI